MATTLMTKVWNGSAWIPAYGGAVSSSVLAGLSDHIADVANPHLVTKAQVGLGSVNNTTDMSKPVSTLTTSAIATAVAPKANTTALTLHTGDTGNPHSVNASQVGLGNVNNTSDMSKPVSTAMLVALALKASDSHSHNDLYYTESEVDSKLSAKANSVHTHTIPNVTGLQAALDAKPAISHTHDDRYNTKAQDTALLAAKANTSHTHTFPLKINSYQNIGVTTHNVPDGTTTQHGTCNISGLTVGRSYYVRADVYIDINGALGYTAQFQMITNLWGTSITSQSFQADQGVDSGRQATNVRVLSATSTTMNTSFAIKCVSGIYGLKTINILVEAIPLTF